MLGLFKGTVLSHPFITPSNIFRLASGTALPLPCGPSIPASPVSHSSHQKKEITAGYGTRSSSALVYIMPEVWEQSKKQLQVCKCSYNTTPPYPISKPREGNCVASACLEGR